MPGLTSEGFDKLTADDCAQQIKTDLWNSVSSKMNLSSSAPMGQVVGIFAEREGILWDAIEAVNDARNPDSASGTALVAVAALTGTRPEVATPTLVTCNVNVGAAFDALPGAMVASDRLDPTKRYTNRDEIANVSGSPVDVLGVVFVAETAGAVECFAGNLIVIAETLSGWNSITNPTDGAVGLDNDTDPALRARRESELSLAGSTTADAIRADILSNLSENITNCKVLTNELDTVDVNSLPPHSLEVLVRGQATDLNASTALATQILASKDACDFATGSASLVIADAEGNDHSIGYTWVNDADVYVTITVKINAKTYPADGDSQVADSIAELNSTFDPGDSVIAELVKSRCFGVTGVVDVPACALDLIPSPTNTANVPIGARQQAVFDTSRIVVLHA